ncbi:MAG TPA: Ig-like domain-containing protein [Urbifossiella sp.]|nr:Ig-like domain-containing protein [Urbifossiella sp.]
MTTAHPARHPPPRKGRRAVARRARSGRAVLIIEPLEDRFQPSVTSGPVFYAGPPVAAAVALFVAGPPSLPGESPSALPAAIPAPGPTALASPPAPVSSTTDGPHRRELLLVEFDVPDRDELVHDLLARPAAGTDVTVVELHGGGVAEITAVLHAYSGLDAIRLLSHGSAGALDLGSDTLDSQSLTDYSADLRSWGAALIPGGDLLLYGCDVAAGAGAGFVSQLSRLTGAAVAASTDPTGAANLGGNWALEYATGPIAAPALAAPAGWSHTLGAVGTGLLFSTKGNVSGGATSGLTSWSTGQVLTMGDPNLAVAPGTSGGTVSSFFDLRAFGGGSVGIDSLDLIRTPVTVGSGTATMTLLPGDLFLTVDNNVTLTGGNGSLAVTPDEGFVFRPTTAGNYSAGSFLMVLSQFQSITHGQETSGLTLVEADTQVGDDLVRQGTFLYSRNGGSPDDNIYQFTPTGVGVGTTAGTTAVLIDGGSDLGMGPPIRGLDLISTPTTIAGRSLPAGTLVMALDNTASVGTNHLAVGAYDVFALSVSKTTLVAGTAVADASLLFRGTDAGLNGGGGFAAVAIGAVGPNSVSTNPAPESLAVDTTSDTADGDTSSVTALLADPGADGHISLREAILAADNTPAGATPVRITFSIASGGAQTIAPTRALPAITAAMTIDGTTQPGFAGAPLIELDGSAAGAGTDALTLGAGSSGSTIRGLAIGGFGGRAILVTGGSGGNRIVGNFLGTDTTGMLARGNGIWGVDLLDAGAGNVIGGTSAADRNVIVWNGLGGIAVNGATTTGTHILGNDVGVGADGTTAAGNGGYGGILLLNSATGTVIGGRQPDEGNTIADNSGGGVTAWDGSTEIVGNDIDGNTGGLGIDLGGDGVTPNDPLDADAGANGLQNFPAITAAVTSGTNLTVAGSLGSTPAASFALDFYASPSADPTGYGQGAHYLGSAAVTTNAAGNAPFAVSYTGAAVPAGWVVSATATDAGGNTSEFSPAVAVDQHPVAGDDAYTTAEDTPLSPAAAGGLLANDGDPDGDPLTAALAAGPAHGMVVVQADGSFTYTPAAGYSGSDSFTYTLSDGRGGAATGTVNLTVTHVNHAPVAADDHYSTAINLIVLSTPLSVNAPGVLADDTDADGDALSAQLVSGPAHGLLTFHSDGSFTYTAILNFSGTDSFTYRVFDGTTRSAPATVYINVSSPNVAPTATADAYTTAEDMPLTVAAPGVLGNDADADGDTLAAVVDGLPAHGSLSFHADGSFTYTPAADWNGTDSFTYHATDGSLSSAPVTVILTVTPVNDPPTLDPIPDQSVPEDAAPVTLGLTGITAGGGETQTLTVTAVSSDPALVPNPTVTYSSPGTLGGLTFQPAPNATGITTITVTVSDGITTTTRTFTVTVTPVNHPPVANPDATTTAEGTPVTVGVLGNDTDADGDPLTVAAVGTAGHGTVTTDGTTVTYTPAANWSGTDSFTYTVSDGNGGFSSATVTVTVTPVNRPPVGAADTYSVAAGAALTVPAAGVLANDSDPDGDPLTAVLVSGPANGTVVLHPDGSFTYTPAAGFQGADQFVYRASDGTSTSADIVVTLRVVPGNRPPVGVDDSYTAASGTVLRVNTPGVLANDTDPDGDPITAVLAAGGSHGTVTMAADGSFTYTPDPGFAGTDAFTYRVSDGVLESNLVTVTVAVQGAALPPPPPPPTATGPGTNPTPPTPPVGPKPDPTPPTTAPPPAGPPGGATAPGVVIPDATGAAVPVGTAATVTVVPAPIAVAVADRGTAASDAGRVFAAADVVVEVAQAQAAPAAPPSLPPEVRPAPAPQPPTTAPGLPLAAPASVAAAIAPAVTIPAGEFVPNEAVLASIDRARTELRAEAEARATTDTLVVSGGVAVAGYVLLNTRAVYWFLSALLVRPAVWRRFDPLDVVYAWEQEGGRRPRARDAGEDESLESIVG